MDNSDNSHHDHNKLGVPRTDALTPGVFGDSVPSRPPSRMSALTFTEANGELNSVIIALLEYD